MSKIFPRRLLQGLAALALAWGLVPAQAADRPVVTTAQVRAELMAHAPEGVEPGKPFWVGLQLTHQPEWHTYWKNSGDSGLPTQLQWQLPEGISAGEIAWPVPEKIRLGSLANYGYGNTVLLPVPLTVSPSYKPPLVGQELEVKLKASWLVCRKECIPEEGEFSLKVPLRGSTALHSADFKAAADAYPKALQGTSQIRIQGKNLEVAIHGLPAKLQGRQLAFFPETPEVIETAAAYKQGWEGAVWTAVVPLASQRSNSPTVMPVVLTEDKPGAREGWRAEVKVSGTWPAAAGAAPLLPNLQPAASAPSAPAATAPAAGPAKTLSPPPAGTDIGLMAALLGALLGGLILNLMPCVFPVLAIKVLAFAQHGHQRREHVVSGLAYGAGVVLSFVALGALMLALRSAGEQLGWGFQLQSPAVVAGLALLFTLLALNLAGVFEFGQILPSGLASLQARHPAVDALLSGVLAVAIASPCTAPFMGASLGFALGLPAAQALLVFACIGIGMALPYVAASLVPAVAKLLPRPGPWMVLWRRAMAFPMLATVVWLVWVLGQQSGIDGAAALLALLLAAAALAWSLALSGRARWLLTPLSLALLALLLAGVGPLVLKPLPPAHTEAAQGERWQSWQNGRVDALLATGKPVFVDFTAAWCVTCQYNKKTTLADAQLLADFDARQVSLLRADWTRRDPAITAALAQLGRNGVPVYVLYSPGRAPQVLSEVISVDEVRRALASL